MALFDDQIYRLRAKYIVLIVLFGIQMLTTYIFIPGTQLSGRYVFARIVGPIIGAIIAGIFFLMQREMLEEADNLISGGRIRKWQ
jgi:hypothetical protein